MSRLFGGALGLAVLSTVAASNSHRVAGISAATALTNGFTVAFQVGAAILIAAAAVAALGLRPRPSAEVAGPVAVEPVAIEEPEEALAA